MAAGHKRRLRRYVPFDLHSVVSTKAPPSLDSCLHSPEAGSLNNLAFSNVQVDRSALLESVFAHIKYKPPDQENNPLSDLPEFDAVTQYCRNAGQSVNLTAVVEREADRLIQMAEHPNDAIYFEGCKLDQFPSRISYQALSEAAEVLHVGVNITRIDNCLVLFEHFPAYSDPVFLERLQNTLQRELDDDPACFKKVDVDLCWALVDFVTAFLARFVTQAFESEFLRQRSLAVLARLSTKLKILCSDSKANAKSCLEEGLEIVSAEELRRLLSGAQPAGRPELGENILDGKGGQGYPPYESTPTTTGPRTRNGTLQRLFANRNKRKGVYFAEMQLFREAILHMVLLLFANLESSSKASGLPVDCFEITSLVYRTGFDQFPVLLGQDRDGEILASSSSDVLRISHAAWLLLGQSMKRIFSIARPPTGITLPVDGVTTTVQWDWEDQNTHLKNAFPAGSQMELGSTSEVVSAMVPLFCTQPPASKLLMSLLIVASTLNCSEGFLENLPREKFTAMVCLKTSNFNQRCERFTGDDAKSLPQSLMTQNYLSVLGSNQPLSRDEWRQKDRKGRDATMHTAEQRFKDWVTNIEGDRWTIDERAIIIQCPFMSSSGKPFAWFWSSVDWR